MRTILLASHKGGAGKTTMAAHLAAIAQRAGYVVRVINLAHGDDGLVEWARQRSDRGTKIVPFVSCSGRGLAAALRDCAEDGVQCAFVDSGSGGITDDILRLCNYVIVPFRPGVFDLAALERTAEMLNAVTVSSAVVIVSREVSKVREARDLLGTYDWRVYPMAISERPAYSLAIAHGVDLTGAAAAEMRVLWTWLASRRELRSGLVKTAPNTPRLVENGVELRVVEYIE